MKDILKWCWKNGISMYREPINQQGDCHIVLIKRGKITVGKQTFRWNEVEAKMIEMYTQIYQQNNYIANSKP